MSSVTVHALSAGHLTLPERFFINPANPTSSKTVPSLSFLIQHRSSASPKPTRIIFDLGLRRSISLYPPTLQHHCATRGPIITTPDVVESLAKGGLTVNDIDYVIFSHVHYDHVGYPLDFNNPNTKFIVGHGALDLLAGRTKIDLGSHCVFEPDLLPPERTIELPDPAETSTSAYHALPPFPHAMSLLSLSSPDSTPTSNSNTSSDTSILLIPSPGHLPGHLNLLVRTSPTSSILLAGDSYHDDRLLDSNYDIATWTDDRGVTCCIHADVEAARGTIERIKRVVSEGLEMGEYGNGGGKTKVSVEVVFAHDWKWEEDALQRGRFWPGQL